MSEREIPTVAVIEWFSTRDKDARGAIARGLRNAGYKQYETAEGLGITTKTVHRYEAVGVGVRPFESAPPKNRPVDSIPEDVMSDLAATHSLASQVRGFSPLDSPERRAADALGALLNEIMDSYGVSAYALSIKLGLNPATFDFWLKRHGFRKNAPSQKNYRNVHVTSPGRKRLRAIGGECMRGHQLTPENVYVRGKNLACKRCQLDNSRRRYLAKKEAGHV
jgi:hypothetical protein